MPRSFLRISAEARSKVCVKPLDEKEAPSRQPSELSSKNRSSNWSLLNTETSSISC